jgi:hypothetical protein
LRCFPLFAPRPKGSLTSENWHKPYADALMEVEPQRLSRLIVEAERAIFVSYLELCMNPRPIEISRDLQNAVYVLIDLKKSIGNPVVVYEESALTPGANDEACDSRALCGSARPALLSVKCEYYVRAEQKGTSPITPR